MSRNFPPDPREIVLFGVVGMSPAVITETVWALAFPPKGTPPLVPHRVRLITTVQGAKQVAKLTIRAPQFGKLSPWEALRKTILTRHSGMENRLQLEKPLILSKPDKHGIHADLDDIRTPDDNEAAADRILDCVREVTLRNDQRLVATIAGGRKTMGALLFGCMNLVAREDDLLTHVLVNEPFDAPLDPPFWFPTKPSTVHQTRDGKEISSAKARIELAHVPFVPLRNRFRDLPEREQVGGYMRLVRDLSGALAVEASRPHAIKFPANPRAVEIDGRAVTLENADQITLLRWLCSVQEEPWIHEGFKEAANHFDGALSPSRKDHVAATLTRTLNELRTRSKKAKVPWAPAPGKLTLPPFKLVQ